MARVAAFRFPRPHPRADAEGDCPVAGGFPARRVPRNDCRGVARVDGSRCGADRQGVARGAGDAVTGWSEFLPILATAVLKDRWRASRLGSPRGPPNPTGG